LCSCEAECFLSSDQSTLRLIFAANLSQTLQKYITHILDKFKGLKVLLRDLTFLLFKKRTLFFKPVWINKLALLIAPSSWNIELDWNIAWRFRHIRLRECRATTTTNNTGAS
jgi:hypothetical protein